MRQPINKIVVGAISDSHMIELAASHSTISSIIKEIGLSSGGAARAQVIARLKKLGLFDKFDISIENRNAWNKGLTADNCEIIRKTAQALKKRYASGELVNPLKGKKHTASEKKRISEAMKLAHKEGRAHNIGVCRWNNEPSWPEKFVMSVISNEFYDKAYTREFPFIRFSLDFAWVHKKKCIEIDGEQHERFADYKARDSEKDRLLIESGWQVLRVKWKDMYKDTKKHIEMMNEFVGK